MFTGAAEATKILCQSVTLWHFCRITLQFEGNVDRLY